MSHPFTAITITHKTQHPDAKPATLNVTDPDIAYTGQVPSVVDKVTIRWAGDCPGRQKTGRTSLTLRSTSPEPIGINSEVLIVGHLAGGGTVTLAHGWVDQTVARVGRPIPTADGPAVVWAVEVDLVDVFGWLSSLIADLAGSWPAEAATSRTARLATLAKISVAGGTSANPQTIAATIPKGKTLLDLIEGALSSPTHRLTETPTGIAVQQLPLIQLPTALEPYLLLWSHRPPITIPAADISAPARTRAKNSFPAQITIGYTPDAASTASQVVTGDILSSPLDTPVRHPATDLPIPTGVTAPSALWRSICAAWLDDLAQAGYPVQLDPATIWLDNLDEATITALLDVTSRGDLAIRIDGLAHNDLDQWQTQHAGELTISPGLDCHLNATLTPTRQAGIRPLRASDLPTTTLPAGTAGGTKQPDWLPPRFSHCPAANGPGPGITARAIQAVYAPRRSFYPAT